MLADVPLSEQSQNADLNETEINRRKEVLHVERHQGDIEKFLIRAPMDGMAVLSTFNRPGGETVSIAIGDTVRPGQQLMKLINPNSMKVEGTVNQSESSLVRIGQDARIGLDAFPGATYSGKVYSIGALAVAGGRSNYYIRSIPISLEVAKPDSRMIPDLSASSDILIHTEKAAIIAPLASIEVDRDKTYVYRKSPQGFERQEVKLGIDNGIQVAILEGIKEGEVIRTN
jgi:HlyD family secretion protein